MRSVRAFLRAEARFLLRQVERVREILASFRARIRAAVADAIGESLGITTRDAVLHLFDSLLDHLPGPGPPAAGPRWGWEHSASPYEPEPWFGAQPDDPYQEYVDEPVAKEDPPPPRRWTGVLAAALRALSWLLPRWGQPRDLWKAAGLVLAVGAAAYAAPALTTLGLEVLGATGSLGLTPALLTPAGLT